MKYYTYLLINSLTGLPFYVGKGSNNRMYKHKQKALKRKHENKHLENTILKILACNGYIEYQKVYESDQEPECLSREISIIKEYGRENLCNLTDGGDGVSGYKHTDKTKSLLSEQNKIRYSDIDTIRKISETAKRVLQNPNLRKKISIETKKAMQCPEIREKMSKLKRGKSPPNKGKDSRKSIICMNCYKEFKSYGAAKYCSIDCYNKEKYKSLIEYTCDMCNAQFFRPSVEMSYLHHFCDIKCKRKFYNRRNAK